MVVGNQLQAEQSKLLCVLVAVFKSLNQFIYIGMSFSGNSYTAKTSWLFSTEWLPRLQTKWRDSGYERLLLI